MGLELLAVAGTSFVLGLSGAMMPGPLLTVTIAETLRRGWRAGPLLVAGHGLLEGALVLALFFGLGDVVRRPEVFTLVAVVGGVLLVLMGWGMWRSIPRLRLALEASTPGRLHPLAAGALVSLANPYFTLWWATVGLGYMVVAHGAGTAGIVVFFLFHLLSDLVWYALVSGSVAAGRRLLSDRIYRGLVGACALFIVVFGCYFGWRGLAAWPG